MTDLQRPPSPMSPPNGSTDGRHPFPRRRDQRLARWGVVGISVVSLLMLVGAVTVQIVGHQEPCPLCVLQRYVCLWTLILSAVVALAPWPSREAAHGDFSTPGFTRALVGVAIGVGLVALLGLGLAIYHTVLVWHPIVSCGFDTLQPLVNAWLTAAWFPTLFQATGMCTNPSPLMGLPLPLWAAGGFFVMLALTAYVLRLARGPR